VCCCCYCWSGRSASLERALVESITAVRSEAWASTRERQQADALLAEALTDATQRLHRGLQAMHE